MDILREVGRSPGASPERLSEGGPDVQLWAVTDKEEMKELEGRESRVTLSRLCAVTGERTLQVPRPQWPLPVPGGRPWSSTWDGICGQTYRDSICSLTGRGQDRPAPLAGLWLALALEQCPRR